MNIQELVSLNRRRNVESAYERLFSPKSPYERLSGVIPMVVAVGYLCQIGSAISSYSFFEDILGEKMDGVVLLMVVGAALAALEVLKRISLEVAFQDYYTNKIEGYNKVKTSAIPAAFMIIGSMYLSVMGGEKLVQIDSARTEARDLYAPEISALKAEIEDVLKRNTWKGSTYIAGTEKDILTAKEKRLETLRSLQREKEVELVAEKKATANMYFYLFGVIDAILLGITAFIYSYKASVVEYARAENVYKSYRYVPPPYAKTAQELRQDLSQDLPKIGFKTSQVLPDKAKNQDKSCEQDLKDKSRLAQGSLFGTPEPVQDLEGLRKAIKEGERDFRVLTKFGFNVSRVNQEIKKLLDE